MFEQDEDTIRWPTDLDRAGIEKRLAYVSQLATDAGLPQVAAAFSGVAGMPAGELATRVVSALAALSDAPEQERSRCEDIIKQLEIVALNLRNLAPR